MTATFTPKPTPVAAQTPMVSAYVGATRLTKARDIKYEEVHNDTGSFSFIVSNDDSQRSLLDHGTVVLFKEFGSTAFAGVVEDISQHTVADGEENAQTVTYSGRSVLAELDRALVYGPIPIETWSGGYLDGLRIASKPFADTRYWNYATLPDADYSSWDAATDIFATGQNPPDDPPSGYTGAPEPWPYPYTQWIAPRAISGGIHPSGDWFATGTWTAASPYVSYDLFFATGPATSATVWVDGVPILTIDAKDSLKPKRVNLAVNEGDHRIVVRLSHLGSGTSGDITGFACVVFPHLDYGYGLILDPVTYTANATGWRTVDFGDPRPGYTVDEIVRSLIGEAQDRGMLALWSFGFTGGDDTASDVLPKIPEFSARVGSKVVDALKSLAENYIEFGVDFTSTYSRELLVWNIPGLALDGGGTATGGGSDSGVELEAGVNLLELTHHSTAPEVTVMLTRWDGGWLELETDADDDRLEGHLSIPDCTDGIQTFWNTARQMVNLSIPGESIEDVRHPMSEATQYAVRDTVTIADMDGTPTDWRCVSRAVSTDADGNGFVTSSFGVPRDDTAARNDRWMRKNGGTLDGRSETAETSEAFLIESDSPSPQRLRFSTGGSGVVLIGDRGTPERVDEPTLIVSFELEADIAGASGDTTVRLEVNGSSVGTATLGTSVNKARAVLADPVLVTVLDWVNIEATAEGGAQGVSATAIGMSAT